MRCVKLTGKNEKSHDILIGSKIKLTSVCHLGPDVVFFYVSWLLSCRLLKKKTMWQRERNIWREKERDSMSKEQRECGQRDRETGKQKERERDRETGRQRQKWSNKRGRRSGPFWWQIAAGSRPSERVRERESQGQNNYDRNYWQGGRMWEKAGLCLLIVLETAVSTRR